MSGASSQGLKLRTGRVVAFLWLAFVVRGFWYCALLPPWEGYDEPFHFAALQHVASGRGMPHADAPISLEVQKSLHLLPLPWMLTLHNIAGPLTSHDEFWRLPPAERDSRIAATRALPPEAGSQPATEVIVNYELQQPPLYYWLFGVAMRWMSGSRLLSRIYILRLCNVLFASVVIPLVYWIARRALGSKTQALGTTATVLLLPELMINLARVSNEGIALVCYTVMLAAAIAAVHKPLSWRAWILLGLALGAGLLSKAYVLSAVPAVILVGILVISRGERAGEHHLSWSSIVLRLTSTLVVTFAIAGAWYVRVHRATGSWTGVKDDVAAGHLSLVQKFAQLPHVNWKSGALSILISHLWFGAWSFLRVPDVIYVLAFVLVGAAIVGVFIRLLRTGTRASETRAILALAAFYLCLWAGLMYDVLVIYLTKGVSASAGWYLYAAVAAEVILMVWGLQAFFPARVVFPGLVLGIAALDLYGMHGLLMPYYTGLTWHVRTSVGSALWVTTTQFSVVFDRLDQLRPPWFPVPALLIAWIGYCVATVGTATAVVLLFRGRFANE